MKHMLSVFRGYQLFSRPGQFNRYSDGQKIDEDPRLKIPVMNIAHEFLMDFPAY